VTGDELRERTERLAELLAEGERTGCFDAVVEEMYAPEAVYTTDYAGVMCVRAEGIREIRATHYDRDMSLGWEGWSFPYQGIYVAPPDRAIAQWVNRGPGLREDGSHFETPGVSLLTYDEEGRIVDQRDFFDVAHQMRLCDELEAAGLLNPKLKESWVLPMKQRLIEMLSGG
jgi:ketosteroid isomerase-like protein